MENSNVSASDFLIQRARKFKQNRKELVEAVEKMREPPPTSRKDAAALAVNTVYRKNLVCYLLYIFGQNSCVSRQKKT